MIFARRIETTNEVSLEIGVLGTSHDKNAGLLDHGAMWR